MTANERLLDAAIHRAIDTHQYSEGVVRRLVSMLNGADADIFAALTSALERMPADSFTVARLEALLQSVRAMNDAVYARIGGDLAAQMRAFGAAEAAFQVALFGSAIPAEVLARLPLMMVTAEQVYAAVVSRPFQGRLLSEWASSIADDRMRRIREAIRVGYVSNETNAQIMTRIRGTRALRYSDGIIEIDRRSLRSVVNTAVSHTAATARGEFYRANMKLIAAEQWVSTLDSRTTHICQARDGKRYTADAHKPIGHDLPWLGGPGRAHWNAVPAGTLIRTIDGDIPVEQVRAGTMVMTHLGRFRPVLDLHCKRCESGVIRAAHTKSGRVLATTYDHPILTSTGWKFMGALEVGDDLIGDQHRLDEVRRIDSAINSKPKNNPTLCDNPLIALARAFELVSTDINLKSDLEVGAREIENRCVTFVLRNPELIEGDQCAQHHLLSVAHALKQLGRDSLGDLLANQQWNRATSHALGSLSVAATLYARLRDFALDACRLARVMFPHALRMKLVSLRSLLCLPPRPMCVTGREYDLSGLDAETDLIALRSNCDLVPSRVGGQRAVGKTMNALDTSERFAADHVFIRDQFGKTGICFGHDPILSLAMQRYDGMVYDLSVEEDASYFAGDLVVSNCRSTSVPVTRSWKDLGIDMPEFSPATRASMDGQVPADLTYGEWLQRQSAARQDEILGPVRGRMMRSGALPWDQMFDRRGRWLTLAQLQARGVTP